ncbi:MAG: threonylcarbamoyl-AMP synthase [Ignavibacteriota bacterium]|jgi:tRNA threonylcarbamoyl adenosine modification protein (Sua5/YciO/YrdC/YwlC family)|nr:MAG: threonylcarbamoyl-AMP synthase [Ignavibacterium sp.]MBL1153972.1 threonylcarbamoyl-AMP synthase [Ignavibacteriota bacterium]MCO6446607.1 threonylcarbamoyl-AMP synthase [Ignavibacterium album]MCZ2269170.1 threonylcarbamoyl-AMP synthase [Ignavibacteriales bacterium]MDX9711232.1 L-threonylcarbamoyladenylate synthase [Ignavibacteriaceae bacterium]
MEYFELHPKNPQIRYINKSVEVLKRGGIIIFPTDTYYGLGCDLFNHDGIEQILSIKGETDSKLFSFICSDLKDISKYAKVSDYAYRTMKHLLPGPYTFILPAAKVIPKKFLSKRKTVGIRVPKHNVTLQIVRELGNPIISTSATTRLGDPLLDPLEIKNIFYARVDLMLASENTGFEPSSVIDLSGDEPEIIREGAGDVSLFK